MAVATTSQKGHSIGCTDTCTIPQLFSCKRENSNKIVLLKLRRIHFMPLVASFFPPCFHLNTQVSCCLYKAHTHSKHAGPTLASAFNRWVLKNEEIKDFFVVVEKSEKGKERVHIWDESASRIEGKCVHVRVCVQFFKLNWLSRGVLLHRLERIRSHLQLIPFDCGVVRDISILIGRQLVERLVQRFPVRTIGSSEKFCETKLIRL